MSDKYRPCTNTSVSRVFISNQTFYATVRSSIMRTDNAIL